MRRPGWLVSLVVTTWLLAPAPAWACFCSGGMPPCLQLWLGGEEFAPVVFEGTVVSIGQEEAPALSSSSLPSPYRKVTFHDIKGWIGEPSGWVMTGMSDADCGYRFEVGRRYVVHATRNHATGGLRTGICDQTRPIEQAVELLSYLRSLQQPSSGATIFGRITLDQDRFSVATPSESSRRPLEGVLVHVLGPVERSILSDADGRYRLGGLPPGEYEVRTEVPSRPELSGQSSTGGRPLRIANAHACASVDVSYAVNGVINGSVVDQDGNPVPSTIVEIRLEVPLQKDQAHYGITPTDALGRFEFRRIPAGRYIVGVNLQRGLNRQSPWAPARSDPPVVELDEGELRVLAPIVVRRREP